jgi:hypothetical protein
MTYVLQCVTDLAIRVKTLVAEFFWKNFGHVKA